MLKLIVGDETGLLKHVEIPLKERAFDAITTERCKISSFGVQQMGTNVVSILNSNDRVLCANKSGAVKIFNEETKTLDTLLAVNSAEESFLNQNNKRVQASSTPDLIFFDSFPNASSKSWFMRGFANGQVDTFKLSSEHPWEFDTPVQITNLKVEGNKSAICAYETFSESSFAYGGKDVNLTLYDIETDQVKHKFKNVPHNHLRMEVPIWITTIEHIENGEKFATGTAHHQIRLYDMKAGKRPTLSIDSNENKFNRIRCSPCGNYIIAANGLGIVEKLDLRKNLQMLGRFPRNKGSVRDVVISDDGEFVATVGLDRYLRVYDFNSRKTIAEVYLKQQLNAVRFHGEVAQVVSKEDDSVVSVANRKTTGKVSSAVHEVEDVEEDGTIWDLLEEVKATNPKKRVKSN